MLIRNFFAPLFLLLFTACVPASKKLTRANNEYQKRFESHVAFLASDSLEGRRTGTRGEGLAKQYLIKEFESIGLQPKGTNGYEQLFEVNEGKKPTDGSHLYVQGDTLRFEKDYFFFPWTASKIMQDKSLPGVREVGAVWIIDLNDGINDNSGNPHFDLSTYVYEQSKKAASNGATGLLLYNTHPSAIS